MRTDMSDRELDCAGSGSKTHGEVILPAATERLRAFRPSGGVTSIRLVEPPTVRHMANRIGVMYLGRLVEVAPARELFVAPRHPYTRMLLDAVPDLDLSGRRRKPVEGEIPNPINPPSGCPFHPRCPYAFERCRAERPALIAAGPAFVACHAIKEGRIGPGVGLLGRAIDPVPAAS